MGVARPWRRKVWRKLLLLNLLNMTEVGATLIADFNKVIFEISSLNYHSFTPGIFSGIIQSHGQP